MIVMVIVMVMMATEAVMVTIWSTWKWGDLLVIVVVT